MKFTDLFIRRPVLAIVVNLVILIAGLQAIRSLNVRQYPRSDIAVVTVTHRLRRRERRSGARLHHHAARARRSPAPTASTTSSRRARRASARSPCTCKLNYDTNAALTQIQAKVAQVRNDLPPEAEAPIIDLQTADSQFAAIYLSFSSHDLDQNQITDYLIRVVQPKLSRRSAACSAPTSSAPAPSPCASGSSPTDGGARHQPRRRCATRWRPTTTSPRSAAPRARWSRSTSSPTPTCRPSRSSSSSSSSRTTAPSSAWATSPTSCSAPRTTTRTSASTAQTAVFMGIWVLPDGQLARRRSSACARRCREIQSAAAGRA